VSPEAREKHAASCEMNPSNRHACRYCKQVFVAAFGITSYFRASGAAARDRHQVSCPQNPGNTCFCGKLFDNPAARDAHAATCDANPEHRFDCQFCGDTFITTFGMLGKGGRDERDSHAERCAKNPLNSACQYCDLTFVKSEVWLGEVETQCSAHEEVCTANPRNRFPCRHCGLAFVTHKRLLLGRDGEADRAEHEAVCAMIPCEYAVQESEGWVSITKQSQPDQEVEASKGPEVEEDTDVGDWGVESSDSSNKIDDDAAEEFCLDSHQSDSESDVCQPVQADLEDSEEVGQQGEVDPVVLDQSEEAVDTPAESPHNSTTERIEDQEAGEDTETVDCDCATVVSHTSDLPEEQDAVDDSCDASSVAADLEEAEDAGDAVEAPADCASADTILDQDWDAIEWPEFCDCEE